MLLPINYQIFSVTYLLNQLISFAKFQILLKLCSIFIVFLQQTVYCVAIFWHNISWLQSALSFNRPKPVQIGNNPTRSYFLPPDLTPALSYLRPAVASHRAICWTFFHSCCDCNLHSTWASNTLLLWMTSMNSSNCSYSYPISLLLPYIAILL